MLSPQERDIVFRRMAPLADQLSKGQESARIAATYMVRSSSPIEVVRFDAFRLVFPHVTGDLTFDVEKLASGILAVHAAPDIDNLVKFPYPHIREQRAYGVNLGKGIIARSVFASTKETAGLILAHCCEAMGVWASDLKNVLGIIMSEKTFYKIEGKIQTPGYEIEDKTAREILVEAHEFQMVLKAGKKEFRDPDMPQ